MIIQTELNESISRTAPQKERSSSSSNPSENTNKQPSSTLLLSILRHLRRFYTTANKSEALIQDQPQTDQLSSNNKPICCTKKRSRLKREACESSPPEKKKCRRSNFCGNNNHFAAVLAPPPSAIPANQEQTGGRNTNYKLNPSVKAVKTDGLEGRIDRSLGSQTFLKEDPRALEVYNQQREQVQQSDDLTTLLLIDWFFRTYGLQYIQPTSSTNSVSQSANNQNSSYNRNNVEVSKRDRTLSVAKRQPKKGRSNKNNDHGETNFNAVIDDQQAAERMYREHSSVRSSTAAEATNTTNYNKKADHNSNYLFNCGRDTNPSVTTAYKPHWQNCNANATSSRIGYPKPLKKQNPNQCFFPPFKSEHEGGVGDSHFRSNEQKYQLRQAVEFLKINNSTNASIGAASSTTTSKRSRRVSATSNKQCPCRTQQETDPLHADDCRILETASTLAVERQNHRLIPNLPTLNHQHLKVEGQQILPFISQSSSNNRYPLECGNGTGNDPSTSRIREKESRFGSKSPTNHADSRTADCCDALGIIFGGLCSGQRVPGKNSFFKFLSGNKANNSYASSPLKHSLYSDTTFNMGCFHSVSSKAKVGPCQTNIHSEVHASIDQSPTVIEEFSPIVLRYRTPYFRANAQVIMPPIRRKETWTVGWIQACDHMKFVNQYGTLGSSSWEIPALKNGKISAVSDSDGVSYPWYGNTTEIATIVGPTDTYKCMHLTMNDNFYPSVTWDIPVSEGTSAHLTRIVRDQSFITWLAAINETTKDIIVLKTVRWNFYLEIDVDPSRELGRRARIVAPRAQKQPLVTPGNGERSRMSGKKRTNFSTDNNTNSNSASTSFQSGQIPFSALVRPSANNAQTLIWRPAGGQPVVVVPAKESHSEVNELVLFNGTSAMKGKECVVKTVSKQQALSFQAQVLSSR